MGSVSHIQAIRPDTAHIKKIIENSLLFDWIIRIEYADNETEAAGWEQWCNTLFAVRSADSIIAAIKSCYTNKAGCAIRINAEKVRPQTRMLFTVYKPQRQTEDNLSIKDTQITRRSQRQAAYSSISV
jgi:ribulose bisphosphate carboxylase small subunit